MSLDPAKNPEFKFPLSGSQKKTAFALRRNAADMIAEFGIERIVFVTFTLGERDQAGLWNKVYDAKEASKLWNDLNRRQVGTWFDRLIVVTERHKDGGIHFHALAVVCARFGNVRDGFDFEAVRRGDYSSAPEGVRSLWKEMREKLPDFGFGRAQAEPVKSCGEAVASYVAKYIEKNLFQRLSADKRSKLVRYVGWNRRQLKPNEFSWATPAAIEWRRNAATIAKANGVNDRAEMPLRIGPRWAWRTTKIMEAVKHAPERDGSDLLVIVREQWRLHEESFIRQVSEERFERELTDEELAQAELDRSWSLPTLTRESFSESTNVRLARTHPGIT